MPLAELQGQHCTSLDGLEYEEPPRGGNYAGDLELGFADGTRLSAAFWRLVKAGRPRVSVFDHRQQYGLPAPIDAFALLRNELLHRRVRAATMDPTTADLRFVFDGELELQVFNLTAYEIWELRFPDGTREFSNHALGP